MLLLDIKEQIIKPLSRPEKQKLFRFLAQELGQEAAVEEAAFEQECEFQPDPAKLRLLSAIAPRPYEPLYDADDAAQTLYKLKHSGSVPVI